jgi:hypothetical protein
MRGMKMWHIAARRIVAANGHINSKGEFCGQKKAA